MSELIRVGRHHMLCGDLTQPETLPALMGDARADVIYSDPPWGPGNQKYWHTMNQRGSHPRTSWETFLASFCAACATYRTDGSPVFVEMGLRWVDELDQAMTKVNLELVQRWEIYYGSKRRPNKNTVALFGDRHVAVELPDPPHGEPVTRAILSSVVSPGDVVLDPCTGLGMTARITHRLGGVFYGCELNHARLDRTVGSLRKLP